MEQITPVTVICGPPGSGKTTYVRERMKWGDLILDLDEIYRALSGLPQHEHPDCLVPFALSARDAIIAKLTEMSHVRHAWVIMGGAKRAARHHLKEVLGAEVIVLAVSPAECLRRIQHDDTRGKWELWRPLVNKWWDDYQPDHEDMVIRP